MLVNTQGMLSKNFDGAFDIQYADFSTETMLSYVEYSGDNKLVNIMSLKVLKSLKPMTKLGIVNI